MDKDLRIAKLEKEALEYQQTIRDLKQQLTKSKYNYRWLIRTINKVTEDFEVEDEYDDVLCNHFPITVFDLIKNCVSLLDSNHIIFAHHHEEVSLLYKSASDKDDLWCYREYNCYDSSFDAISVERIAAYIGELMNDEWFIKVYKNENNLVKKMKEKLLSAPRRT